MGFGLRFFIFDEDGSIKRLPQQFVNDLVFDGARLTERANQAVRVARVSLETENKKPVRIRYVAGDILRFDSDGTLERSLETAVRALEEWGGSGSQQPEEGAVVDFAARLEKRKSEERDRWEVTPKEINQIIHAIWPETAGREVDPVPYFRGDWKRRPPMTHKAKQALSEVIPNLSIIRHELEELDDKSLRALAAEIVEDVEWEDVLTGELCVGIARAVDRELERRKAWKTKKGKWFAVAEVSRRDTDSRYPSFTVDTLEHVECDHKDKAIRACRDLLKKHADLFDERVDVCVEIRPAIEWKPREL